MENRVFALNHRIRKRRCKRKSSSWNDLLPAGISLMGGWRKSSCILNSGCNLAAKWLIVAKLWATRQTSRGRLLSVHTWTAPSRQLARKKTRDAGWMMPTGRKGRRLSLWSGMTDSAPARRRRTPVYSSSVSGGQSGDYSWWSQKSRWSIDLSVCRLD